MRRILVLIAAAVCAAAATVLVVDSGRPLAAGLALAIGAALALLLRSAARIGATRGDAAPVAAQPPRLLDGAVTPEDWPAGPFFDRRDGKVTLGFTVDCDGRARDLRVTHSSGVADLDQRSLEIVERFRFAPARAADGSAVEAPFEHEIAWTLAVLDGTEDEAERPAPLQPMPRPAG